MENVPEKKEVEAGLLNDDALASFNKEFKELQERYQLRVLGIPLITPDGRILVSIQAVPQKHEQDVAVESPYNKND